MKEYALLDSKIKRIRAVLNAREEEHFVAYSRNAIRAIVRENN